MNPNLDRRRFLTGSAALALPGLAGSWTASGCSSETSKRSLVIDHHVHVFPDQTGPLGYDLTKNDRQLAVELETLERAVDELGYRGLCSHLPKGQPRDDPRADALWKACIRLKIPVFLETG